MKRHDMTWHETTWHETTWHNMTLHVTTWDEIASHDTLTRELPVTFTNFGSPRDIRIWDCYVTLWKINWRPVRSRKKAIERKVKELQQIDENVSKRNKNIRSSSYKNTNGKIRREEGKFSSWHLTANMCLNASTSLCL